MANFFDQFDAAPSAPPATPAPSAPATGGNFFDQFDQKPAPAGAPASAPASTAQGDSAFDTVKRLQPKIDAGDATPEERQQWLMARSQDLHETSLAGRVARAVIGAPYSKIPGQVIDYFKGALKGSAEAAPSIVASQIPGIGPLFQRQAAQNLGSAAAGFVGEAGQAGKTAASAIGNTGVLADSEIMHLNPFTPESKWAADVQAHHELAIADALSKIKPEAVKDLAPNPDVAKAGSAAFDAASVLAGGAQAPAKAAAMVPEDVEAIGSVGNKVAGGAARMEKLTDAADQVAEKAPFGTYKAAAQYGAQTLRQIYKGVRKVPFLGPTVEGAVNTIEAAAPATKGAVSLAKAVATTPALQRAAAGSAAGAAVGGLSASPGETQEGVAGGAGMGALAGAARSPEALRLVNGETAAEPLTLARREPPVIQEAMKGDVDIANEQRPAKPTLAASAPSGEPQGPQAAGSGSVEAALQSPAAGAAPLKLAPQQPQQPVSRFSGGAEAIGGLRDFARAGNSRLRAKLATGSENPTADQIVEQIPHADKPIATLGPVPADEAKTPASQASQNLGAAIEQEPAAKGLLNTLFGGNRSGEGTPTEVIRPHNLAPGTEFRVNGVRAVIQRPEGVTDRTIVSFPDNPSMPDIRVYKPASSKIEDYTFPTDKGPVQIARIDPENPVPYEIGGEPHQLIGSKPGDARSPVVLAKPSGEKVTLASRMNLNADKGTAPSETAPVPLKDVVGSSNISKFGYDANTGTLYVQTKGGRIYDHPNVPIEEVRAMEQAESKGKYYAKLQKQYPDSRKLASQTETEDQNR